MNAPEFDTEPEPVSPVNAEPDPRVQMTPDAAPDDSGSTNNFGFTGGPRSSPIAAALTSPTQPRRGN